MKPLLFGVLGCGHWGPNHVRNLLAMRGAGVAGVIAADANEARRRRIAELHPGLRVEATAEAVIADPRVDALVIATPAHTHVPFAREAMLAGKHVLVEKPFATRVDDAEALAALARRLNRVLIVGHTFTYNSAVNRVREYIEKGDLGEVQYIRSQRVNLGIFHRDVNVLWDLAPHDISILQYILKEVPTHVCAVGNAHVTEGLEDVAVITLRYASRKMANVIVSWLDPRKVREFTIVGKHRMLVYDDTSANEKIRIYDKSVDGPRDYDSFGDFAYSYRYGDIVTPMIDETEPLKQLCADFVDCIRTGRPPRAGGDEGISVTRVLVAAQWSLRHGGAPAQVADAAGLETEPGIVARRFA